MRKIMLGVMLVLAIPATCLGQTQYWKVVEPAIACRDWDVYTRLLGYKANNDEDGFEMATTAVLRSGDCTILKPGEPVAVLERGFVSVRLRRKGALAEYWTARENVSPH
jgi:hypothetical protein